MTLSNKRYILLKAQEAEKIDLYSFETKMAKKKNKLNSKTPSMYIGVHRCNSSNLCLLQLERKQVWNINLSEFPLTN